MIGVVISRADTASVTIGDQLRTRGDWTAFEDRSNPDGWGARGYRRPGITVREFDDWHLELSDVAAAFDDPSLVVFASRHSGETGQLLSTHFTGNIGAAEYGGDPRTLATAAPNAGRHLLQTLDDVAPPDYEVSLECTHHGPTDVGAPSLFVEVGSGEDQWTDPEATEAVASAILQLRGVDPVGDRTIVSIGEGHYAPRATRIVRETDWAVGHVAPDWAIPALTGADTVIDQLFTRSTATHAILTDVPDAVGDQVRRAGYTVVSETWVRETTGVDLDRVTALESLLCTVDDGLRFGDRATVDDDLVVQVLPEAVLDASLGVDVAATRSAVEATTAAFETTEGGSRVAGRVAVPTPPGFDPVLEALGSVLETGYDTVEVQDDAIVVTDTVFDPAAARDHGVPEGPQFGRLADGESVTVDGDTITPEMVTTRRTRRLPL
ncbi:MAG: D-aminoacyl-tRNA deacylase [Halobacteriaceae archaeon]